VSSRSSTLESVTLPRRGEEASAIERSYKARAVEGFLDIHFYRKIGLQLARGFAKLGLRPAHVTVCGAAAGIAAGHFYYYRDLRWNLLGMGLHVLSNALDNADGQLARLTKQGSRSGRALDGLADHLVFVSIYAHLSLRYTAGGGSPWVWLLALGAGLSHSLQSAAADYFRNAWLYFAEGKSCAELDSCATLQAEFERLRWRDHPWQKFLLKLHLNYTRQQEWLAPALLRLKRAATGRNNAAIAAGYQTGSRPLLKWLNLLATNPRMILLFALLFIGQPVWYFVAEVSFFNFVLMFLLRRERIVCRRLLA
jgi:phosphatidylglycerophosphate synthase